MTKNEMISEIKKLSAAYNLTCFADMDKWGEAHLKDFLKGLNTYRSWCECEKKHNFHS